MTERIPDAATELSRASRPPLFHTTSPLLHQHRDASGYNSVMDDSTDYLKFYDDEHYLLAEVGPRFRDGGTIDAADFYMILIWKANRAKTYHLKRLKSLVQGGTLQDAVNQIAASVKKSATGKERLRVLMADWWFSLPTASAILTIL